MNLDLERRMISFKCEELLEWEKWREEIPYIQFPPDWKIKIVPPCAGAIVRFWVQKEDSSRSDYQVSVYLDCYNMLGVMYKPYWEIYPDKGGDNSRFDMNDTEGLLKAIAESLEEQAK